MEKYLESVNKADVTLASQVFLPSLDISAVAPFGRFKGWEGVRDGVYINFLQKVFAERSLRPDNLAITVSGKTAWAVFRLDLRGQAGKRTALLFQGMGEPRVPED